MARSLTRSNAHFRAAVRRLPLGVSSNFRYWGDDATVYVKRGRGARVWDLDDNVYIDWPPRHGGALLPGGRARQLPGLEAQRLQFYDALARNLIGRGVMCEPDSREPWFICAAHDEGCLAETLEVFEESVDATRRQVDSPGTA
jgi:glutamate-1-semialdehyde aminotransferase